tara:strand:- start:180 stop:881 length:702 start_codon:yes stop_codon:yes gene_type:complete
MKAVAICVGHSRPGDNGAVSVTGESEWNYNEVVAETLGGILQRAGVKVSIFDMYQGENYGEATTWLADRLNESRPDCAIELHFNASDNPAAEGFEYIHWGSSLRGQRMAKCFLSAHEELSFLQNNRGAKEADFETRGAAFLRKPSCPCLICEPFFGTSPREWALFGTEDGQGKLAVIYATALADYLGIDLNLPYRKPDKVAESSETRSSEILARINRIESELAAIKSLLPDEY